MIYDGTPAAGAGAAKGSDVRRKPGRLRLLYVRIHLTDACAGVADAQTVLRMTSWVYDAGTVISSA